MHGTYIKVIFHVCMAKSA